MTSRGNRIKSVIKAVDYIEEHLTERLDLDAVADAVHYSKYHLHRMFSHTVGLTMHDYIQRRRLTEAAKLLFFSEKSIMEIAILIGYESQQAFTNLFTDMYKEPPNRFRTRRKFYPLQLKFVFKEDENIPSIDDDADWDIGFATEADIPLWMDLVRLVIDGFPYLDEQEYIETLSKYIRAEQALILKEMNEVIGVMLFSAETGSIDFMGIHPFYGKTGVAKAFLDKVMGELTAGKEISITTYREGDRADTGHRKQIISLGFAEAELLEEFGYPTQRFILQKGEEND